MLVIRNSYAIPLLAINRVTLFVYVVELFMHNRGYITDLLGDAVGVGEGSKNYITRLKYLITTSNTVILKQPRFDESRRFTCRLPPYNRYYKCTLILDINRAIVVIERPIFFRHFITNQRSLNRPQDSTSIKLSTFVILIFTLRYMYCFMYCEVDNNQMYCDKINVILVINESELPFPILQKKAYNIDPHYTRQCVCTFLFGF